MHQPQSNHQLQSNHQPQSNHQLQSNHQPQSNPFLDYLLRIQPEKGSERWPGVQAPATHFEDPGQHPGSCFGLPSPGCCDHLESEPEDGR
uniref:Putative chimeric protein 305 n=1 Tax=Trypanosoma cruzi TaxID=5693 RepID=Q6RV07_TRYCR|nr:putative chimeric protein 305 [Trypanosoma cruzi]